MAGTPGRGCCRRWRADLSLGDDFDPLDADWAAPWLGPRPALLADIDAGPWRHHGDTRERLEMLALRLLDGGLDDEAPLPHTAQVLARLRRGSGATPGRLRRSRS